MTTLADITQRLNRERNVEPARTITIDEGRQAVQVTLTGGGELLVTHHPELTIAPWLVGVYDDTGALLDLHCHDTGRDAYETARRWARWPLRRKEQQP